jgi:hypothetical protein
MIAAGKGFHSVNDHSFIAFIRKDMLGSFNEQLANIIYKREEEWMSEILVMQR